ncbi:MAG: response regulator [Vicinamibacterales bacterium]
MQADERGTILIADDDAATLHGLTEFLTDAGYRVVPARDGQQALDFLLAGAAPILLIVDIAMPHLAGGELLRYVQSDPVLRFVPVLVVTGAPERAGRAVADAILTKPVDLLALLAHVRRLTDRTQHKAEAEVSRHD